MYVLICSVLFLGMLQFYLVLQKTLEDLQIKLELQHKYHVSSFLLRYYLQQAGYVGIAGSLTRMNYINVNSSVTGKKPPLGRVVVCNTNDNSCKSVVSAKIWRKIGSKQIKPDSQILLIHDIPLKVGYLLRDMGSRDEDLVVTSDFWHELAPNEELIITDLNVSERFIGSAKLGNKIGHSQPENISNNLAKAFQQRAEIIKLDDVVFYLAKEEHLDLGGYSLYLDHLTSGSKAQAVVAGLTDFRVKIIDNNLSAYQPMGASAGLEVSRQGYLLVNAFFNAGGKIHNLVIGEAFGEK